jgi:hypothetical protein
LIEYVITAGIVGAAITFIDKENLIPQISNNAGHKFWWDASRWVTTPPAARFPQPQPIRFVSPQQQIQNAQFEIANAQRKIASAVPGILASSAPMGLSKYAITS